MKPWELILNSQLFIEKKKQNIKKLRCIEKQFLKKRFLKFLN